MPIKWRVGKLTSIKKVRFEYTITIIYLTIGGTWIVFSDKFLDSIAPSKQILTQLQTAKGWFYVVVTAFIFFLFIKKHLQKLRMAQKKVEENDQLKTAFLHNISHEIRTPMNSIIGFSSLLKDPSLSAEKREYYADIIEQNSNNLLSIMNDIMDISSIEAGQTTIKESEVDVHEIIEQVYNQFSLKATQQNIGLNYSCPSDDKLLIFTDRIKLFAILTNLVGNAIKFTPNGAVKFGCAVQDSTMEFWVEDTGIGIPAELHDEVFKRFQRVEKSSGNSYRGSGLGLSISKAYVELIGGKIWLTSELGKGSTFYFTIPYKRV